MKTCLHRIFRNREGCESCSPDYNPEHYPNNHHCPDYYEINMWTFEVTPPTNTGENQNALDRKISPEKI